MSDKPKTPLSKKAWENLERAMSKEVKPTENLKALLKR